MFMLVFSFLLTRSFKTFKLKKKSSTLGINKTSESPPALRRDEDRYGSQTTYDGGMRHTVDIGLGNSFQRGAPSRSSLQDLNSTSRVRNFFAVYHLSFFLMKIHNNFVAPWRELLHS